MNNPLISFLVPSHNKGSWLADCLWSIFSQTYKPIEIVICDNGSTDQSLDIIHYFSRVPGLITIIADRAMGSAWALQRCLERASGEWIIKLDADDIVTPAHAENMIKEAIKSKADMIFGDFVTFQRESEIEIRTTMDTIFYKCQVGLCSAIIRKSAADDIGGFDESMTFSEDWEFIIRMIKSGKVVAKGSKTGYIYRRVDVDAESVKFQPASPDRAKNHKYIREKHGLGGPCLCGCGAE